jgi:DNA replication protein DnaC
MPVPKEWIPPLEMSGRAAFANFTGWVTQLTNSLCPSCFSVLEKSRLADVRRKQEAENNETLSRKLTLILGGERPVHDFTFDKFKVSAENQDAYKASLDFVPQRENLFLWGEAGRGKTHLACAIARKLLWEGHRVEFIKPRILMMELRAKDSQQQLRMLREYGQIPVLIFDEFGRGNDSEFTCDNMRDILDFRDFNWQGGMVMTSNFSPEEIAEKMGDSIPSRILKNFKIVKVGGEDMRLKLRETAIVRPERPFTSRGTDRRGESRQPIRIQNCNGGGKV